MQSLRTKLARQYAVIVLAAMTGLAVVMFVVQSSAESRESAERAAQRADGALRVLRGASFILKPEEASIAGDEERVAVVFLQLEALQGVLLGFHESIRAGPFFRSKEIERLSRSDSAALWQGLDRLGLGRAPVEGAFARPRTAVTVRLGGERVMLVRRDEPDPAYPRFQAVAGVPVGSGAFRLLGTALVFLPLLVLASIAGMYAITNRALEPLDRITSEVAAISDGRSLHRRLPSEEVANDEWGRLAAQLNAMIGRLETSFGALRRFTADASHELKTPLAVLRADVERAMHVPQASNEQLVALEEALQETTRMANLVESLLTLARADEGRFDLHRERIELLPLARDVFETAVILGEDAALTVTMPVAQDATVDGDPTRLRQLLLNLITNAIKYTPKGGEVELSLVRSDHEVTFSVRDTGIGIAAADLPHIFERFYRADRVRSRADERGGFGLGLSISQWIAQAHGGSLTVQSRLHRGSIFTVTLPLASDEPGGVGERADRTPSRATSEV
jgi:signal transduction histidine kinase